MPPSSFDYFKSGGVDRGGGGRGVQSIAKLKTVVPIPFAADRPAAKRFLPASRRFPAMYIHTGETCAKRPLF